MQIVLLNEQIAKLQRLETTKPEVKVIAYTYALEDRAYVCVPACLCVL